MKKPISIKKNAPFLTLLILILGLFFFFLRPAYLELDRIKKEIGVKQKMLADSKSIIAESEKLAAQLEAVKKSEIFYRAYFASVSETDMLKWLAGIAEKSDIYYAKIEPVAGKKKEPIAKTVSPQTTISAKDFSLSFQVSYTQLRKFMRELERIKHFATVKSFKIDATSDPYNPETETILSFHYREDVGI
ncbi:MAG: hypothetical protein WC081_03190 [Candidatus Ratteibacteria bacterium]|jgi:DUF438 domain-containing protein